MDSSPRWPFHAFGIVHLDLHIALVLRNILHIHRIILAQRIARRYLARVLLHIVLLLVVASVLLPVVLLVVVLHDVLLLAVVGGKVSCKQ